MAFLVCLAGNTVAQDFERESLISFARFKESTGNLKVPGFTGPAMFEHYEEEGEYEAVFTQGNEVFLVKLEARHFPPVWYRGSYKFDGRDAEFSVIGNVGILIIDLPDTYSVLSLSSTKIKDRPGLEKLARETGLMDISPLSTVAWPSVIHADYRISGLLLEASESLGSDAGFSREVRVGLVMSEQLKESLLALRDKCVHKGGEEVFYRFSNGMILNLPFSDISDINSLYRNNDMIRFTYYIP